jgi:hypothetical protein
MQSEDTLQSPESALEDTVISCQNVFMDSSDKHISSSVEQQGVGEGVTGAVVKAEGEYVAVVAICGVVVVVALQLAPSQYMEILDEGMKLITLSSNVRETLRVSPSQSCEMLTTNTASTTNSTTFTLRDSLNISSFINTFAPSQAA